MELFDTPAPKGTVALHAPLAERIRPTTLDTFVGQEHLLGEGRPLRVLIETDQLPSMIFWGPPGSGKTTLARIIASHTKAEFFQLNAVAVGVKEVRDVLLRAKDNLKHFRKRTLLFIDEIHRFNKAQQDALLHSVEDGLITLIGATTENPSFEVIPPLLSRARVYALEPLTAGNLSTIIDYALRHDPFLATEHVVVEDRGHLILLAGGDARMMLNGLDTAARLAPAGKEGTRIVGAKELEEAFQKKHVRYDNNGEEHYNIISAFIKSVRGSDPDAAIYWLARMLEGGEDPKFIARRLIILASEDIGNANPSALILATSAFAAVDYIGMPEARLVLAQATTYLASSHKSNASYQAIGEATADVRTKANESVPLHLRNAPTPLMKELGYGEEYKYSHAFDNNFVDQNYLPEGLKGKVYYRPTENGDERTIKERLNSWWKARRR